MRFCEGPKGRFGDAYRASCQFAVDVSISVYYSPFGIDRGWAWHFADVSEPSPPVNLLHLQEDAAEASRLALH
jgi:hypothetical protein